MQTSGRLAAVTVSLALLSAVPATSMAAPSDDHRQGTSWTTVGRFAGAKHQACKVPVGDGAAWRIKNRLVNGNQGRVGAGMTVQNDGKDTDRTWQSGLVRKGKTSAVGFVRIPRGNPAFTLSSFEYQSQSGTGRSLDLSDVGRC